MLQKLFCLVVLLVPIAVNAQSKPDIHQYLLGKWEVQSVKDQNDKTFHPPHHKLEWEFQKNGKLIESLGKKGAKIHWRYHLLGRDIIVQLNKMSFRWQILATEPGMMLLQHQLGLLRVRRM